MNSISNRPFTVDVQSSKATSSNSSISKHSEFKTSSSSSSNFNQQTNHLENSFNSKKNAKSNTMTDKTLSNGDNADDFGLFVSKIESKPDDSSRVQFLTNQVNNNNNKNSTKKKVINYCIIV